MAKIDVPALIKRHEQRLQVWVAKGVHLVSGKVADAHAHAEKAVTDALRATPDGKPSIARIRQSPSFQAALNRLDELQDALGGPTVTSLRGLVQDASEAFYEDSRELWWDVIPEAYRTVNKSITDSQRRAIRSTLWHGTPIRQALATVFSSVKTSLLRSIGAAGSTAATQHSAIALLQSWHDKTRRALMQTMGTALGDANQRADAMARADTIAPEFRHGS